jgi:hypothetical protein
MSELTVVSGRVVCARLGNCKQLRRAGRVGGHVGATGLTAARACNIVAHGRCMAGWAYAIGLRISAYRLQLVVCACAQAACYDEASAGLDAVRGNKL